MTPDPVAVLAILAPTTALAAWSTVHYIRRWLHR